MARGAFAVSNPCSNLAVVEQLSFYSAQASTPRVGDLAGLLCGPGRVRQFARGTARLTIPVDAPWRANALVTAFAERGVQVRPQVCEYLGTTQLRTAFRADLVPLAVAWGAAKDVPAGFTPYGAVLRMWVMAAGGWVEGGYRLAIDPAAPHTQGPLLAALARCGLPATAHDGDGPGVRITGRRRLARLLELVGPPAGPSRPDHWPAAVRMRVVS
ncbi:hypothetical protein ACTG9Q_11645 [Actinokineospora sp. 24-640]